MKKRTALAICFLMSCQHTTPTTRHFQRTLPQKTIYEENRIPPAALALATNYLKNHASEFANKRYLSIIDYSQPSSNKRFYLLDLDSQQVEVLLVAHGKGSDPHHSGMSHMFSDALGSQATALGFYKTAGIYNGAHGVSLKLIGLSATNKNALARAIVVHGASYVTAGRKILGRSWGCPAVATDQVKNLIEKIKGGSLLLAWHPTFKD